MTSFREGNLVAIQLKDNRFEIKQIENGYLTDTLAILSLTPLDVKKIEVKTPVEFCRAAIAKYLERQQ